MMLRRLLKRLSIFFKFVFLTSGMVFMLLLILSFTSLPFYAYHWLGTSMSKLDTKPAYIVFLGGGGMPSESNLMRAHYTVKAAKAFPESKIVISLPGNLLDETSTPILVSVELQNRGIAKDRIFHENIGKNTRSQALKLRFFRGESFSDKPILLVTSPEHMRRSVLTFEKAGFLNVNALPAFENALEADLMFIDDELGGNRFLTPDVGGSIIFRYRFWNHLKYEVLIAREITAMAYYKVRAWI